ncbi:MAG: ABC transporter ATP-binding protein [Cyanobacteria bacterium M_surface_10_m2_119]|nr:ABC transporter ATP-binding protein [Cyanobacteria bacterium M_surface_10_m2_119]
MARLDRQRLARLLPYLGQDRNRLILSLVLLLPVAGAAAIQPLLVGQGIAVLRGEPTFPWLQALEVRDALRLLVFTLLLAVLVRLGLQGLQTYNVQAVGQRLTARIRDDLFAHAMALSLRFHDRTPVGKLLTRLTSDVDALAEVFGSGAVGVLADLVTLLVIAGTMLTIEWRLGLLLLAAQVPVVVGMLWLQRRYRRANYRVREELSQLNADLQENLQGLEVVQMFRREAINSARFAATTNQYRKAVTGTILYESAISAFIEWVALIAVAAVLALGGTMVTAGALGLGTLTTFILFSQRLFDPLRQLAERFTQIQGGLTAVERIGELLEQPIEIRDLPLAQRSRAALERGDVQRSAGEVVFENVSFAYRPDEPILSDLSFRIAAGEHVALVGPTGSGKTTVIRLLCRLYEPQQGRILLDGIDIRELPLASLRRRLGVVLQDTFLFSGTVADNLRLDADIDSEELRQLTRDLGLSGLVSRLPDGLATELRERGGNLSSGERQLLAVARVAIRDPSVLVMDEATAFMDPSTEATLQRDLERLLQRRTAIVIAHRLATVEAADRILVLRRGRLIEEGNHQELRRAGGLYAQLAELQERGLASL